MKTLVMLMGPPGAGKTTTHGTLFAGFPLICSDQFWPRDKKGRRYWMDDDGIRHAWGEAPIPHEKLMLAVEDADRRRLDMFQTGQDFVFEAVFAKKEYREKVLKQAKFFGYQTHGLCFFPPLRVVVGRNGHRHDRVPDQVLAKFYGEFEIPTLHEGFYRLEIKR